MEEDNESAPGAQRGHCRTAATFPGFVATLSRCCAQFPGLGIRGRAQPRQRGGSDSFAVRFPLCPTASSLWVWPCNAALAVTCRVLLDEELASPGQLRKPARRQRFVPRWCVIKLSGLGKRLQQKRHQTESPGRERCPRAPAPAERSSGLRSRAGRRGERAAKGLRCSSTAGKTDLVCY